MRDAAYNAILYSASVDEVVGVAGFEPTAFRSQSGRATKLRHTPSVRHVGYMHGDSATPPFPRGVREPPMTRYDAVRAAAHVTCGATCAGVAQW